jgi:predicted MFS family arabinose efflux permease
MDKKSFHLFCLAFLSVTFGFLALFSLAPRIAYTLDVDASKMFHLSWFYILFYGLAALLWALSTRIATVRELFIANCFGFAFCSLLFSVASTFQVAHVTQLLTGIFASSFIPLALIVINKEVRGKEKGKYFGILLGISCLSTLVGLALSGFLFWRKFYLISSGLGAVTFLLALKYFKEFDYRGSGAQVNKVLKH